MSYNYERDKLLPKARQCAIEKHPNGFNKAELVKCGEEIKKELVGDFAVGLTRIRNEEDIRHAKNYLSEVDGHYPRGVSDCFAVGINGDCGLDCLVFQRGDCKIEDPQPFLELLKEEDIETQNIYLTMYPTLSQSLDRGN